MLCTVRVRAKNKEASKWRAEGHHESSKYTTMAHPFTSTGFRNTMSGKTDTQKQDVLARKLLPLPQVRL